MKSFTVCLLFSCIVGTSAGENGAPYLHSLIDSWTAWRGQMSPDYGAQLGSLIFSDQLESYNYDVYDQRMVVCQGYLEAAKLVNETQLQSVDQMSLKLLIYQLQSYIDGNKWKNYNNLNSINFLETDYSFGGDPWTPDELGYRDMVTRASSWVAQIRQQSLTMMMAIQRSLQTPPTGFTYNQVSINRLLPDLNKLIDSGTLNSSTLVADKIEALWKVESIPLFSKNEITEQLENLAHSQLLPTLIFLRNFFVNNYLPACRTGAGIFETTPDYAEYYTAAVRWSTSVADITPDEIYATGLAEVERITPLMLALVDQQAPGEGLTVLQYADRLREFGQHPANESDLLDMYTRKVELITSKLGLIFHQADIPNIPVVVTPLNFDGPEGMYGFATENSSGSFFVNTADATERAVYTQMSLTLHESNPGHHLQTVASLNQADLPLFRRKPSYSKTYATPTNFPYYNSYLEGWALYAESLGFEEYLDVLQDNDDKFGVYSWEMFRACRLVVDVGLHYKGWSRTEAISYMYQNSGIIYRDIEQEVDRYMTWPGQATGYKIGEIVIRELREDAKTALGATFDIKDFHHEVLKTGPVPLDLLQANIRQWYSPSSGVDSSVGSCVVLFLSIFVL